MLKLSLYELFQKIILVFLIWTSQSCASGGGGTGDVLGNESGSAPVNDNEAQDYKKAIVRCYKTGGTRVVKIMGTLRCY
jgi:hypothetical protein